MLITMCNCLITSIVCFFLSPINDNNIMITDIMITACICDIFTGCGGVIHVTNVTQFTSPGYPAHYRNRMRCIWLIKVGACVSCRIIR